MATTATTHINQALLASYMGVSKQAVHRYVRSGVLATTDEPEMKERGIRVVDAIHFLLTQSAKLQGRSFTATRAARLYYKAAEALVSLLPDREADAILPPLKATAKANVVTLDAARSKRNEA